MRESLVRSSILEVALTEVGYTENSVGNTKYHDWYGLQSVPWDVMFVSWCAAQIHIPTSIISKMAYCPYLLVWFKSRDRFYRVGTKEPEKGDLIFFTEDGETAERVGLVLHCENSYVSVVEGCCSGKVSCNLYNIQNSYILGYGSPNYRVYENEQFGWVRAIDGLPQKEGSYVTIFGDGFVGNNYFLMPKGEEPKWYHNEKSLGGVKWWIASPKEVD